MSTAQANSLHPYERCPSLSCVHMHSKEKLLAPSSCLFSAASDEGQWPHDLLRTCRAGQPMQQSISYTCLDMHAEDPKS